MCTRIWVRAMTGLLKKVWSICQSGSRKYPTNSSDSLSPLETQNKDTGAEFRIGDLLREEVAKEVRLYRINANCWEEP